MTDASRVTVDGEERLASTLHGAADDLATMEEAERRSGRLVQIRAQSLAPIATGDLRRSITVREEAGEALVVSSLDYAIPQEFGTTVMAAHPYMRPALEDSTTQIVQLFTYDAQKALDRVKGA